MIILTQTQNNPNHKTLHRKLKIEHYETHKRPRVNTYVLRNGKLFLSH